LYNKVHYNTREIGGKKSAGDDPISSLWNAARFIDRPDLV
jgi:hypothetical protein